MEIVWNDLRRVYGNKNIGYNYNDDDDDGDYDLPKRNASPDPEWVNATRGVSPPPYDFSSSSNRRASFFRSSGYTHDDDKNHYERRLMSRGSPSPSPSPIISASRSSGYTYNDGDIIQQKIYETLENIPWLSYGIINCKYHWGSPKGQTNGSPVIRDSMYSIQISGKNQHKILLMPFCILPHQKNAVLKGHGNGVQYSRSSKEKLTDEEAGESSLAIAPSKYTRPFENCYVDMSNDHGAQMMKKFIFEPCDYDILTLINDERNYLKTSMKNEMKLKAISSSSSSSETGATSSSSSSSETGATSSRSSSSSSSSETDDDSSSSETDADSVKKPTIPSLYGATFLYRMHDFVDFIKKPLKNKKDDDDDADNDIFNGITSI
jgi:hypothetical protein